MKRDIINTNEVLNNLTSELIYSLETEIIKKNKLGLLDGMAGISLYLFYYGKFKDSSKFSEIAENTLVEIFSILNRQPNVVGHDYAEGRTGIFATLYHLLRNNLIKPDFFEYEEYIDYNTYINCLKYIKEDNIDFFYGAGGLLYLLFLRLKYEKSEYLRDYIISILEEMYVSENPALMCFQSEQRLNTQIEVSIPHGISSWIIILSKIKNHINIDIINRMLSNLYYNYYAPFIKSTPLNNSNYFLEVIPDNYNYCNQNEIKSRLGWCYGDIPALLASINFSEVIHDEQLIGENLRILSRTAQRRDLVKDRVFDACLCHGSSGLYIFFSEMMKKYNCENCTEASSFWLNKIYEFNYKDKGFCKEYMSKGKIISSKEYGLIEGITGIGLALLSSLSKENHGWEELILF